MKSPAKEPVVNKKDKKGKGQRSSQLNKKYFFKFSFLMLVVTPSLSFFYTRFMVYEQLLGKQGRKISDPENRH